MVKKRSDFTLLILDDLRFLFYTIYKKLKVYSSAYKEPSQCSATVQCVDYIYEIFRYYNNVNHRSVRNDFCDLQTSLDEPKI